jgi:glyoxylase-like metal-dependent hydrolase (beta-lactamase superfamily II)
MVAAIQADGLEPQAIVLTHAHLDHVEGVPDVRAAFPDLPIFLHPADGPLYDAVQGQAAMFGLSVRDLPPVTDPLSHGQVLGFGTCSLEVRHAPGHAPGHVILVSHRDGVAVVADVVFRGSIGRTDLPGGNFQQLIEAIREQVLTLPGDTRLLTGHGPETTVDLERTTNPFLIPHYGGDLA